MTNDYQRISDQYRRKGNNDLANIYNNYALLSTYDGGHSIGGGHSSYSERKSLANDINNQLLDQKNKAFEIGKTLTDEQKNKALSGQGTTEVEKKYANYKQNINSLSSQQKTIGNLARLFDDDWTDKK